MLRQDGAAGRRGSWSRLSAAASGLGLLAGLTACALSLALGRGGGATPRLAEHGGAAAIARLGRDSGAAAIPWLAQDDPPYWLRQGPGVTSFGAFAGYLWRAAAAGSPRSLLTPVRSVAGSWTVPRVLPGSHRGIAGTWIGVQAPGGAHAPFIQVGINEQREAIARIKGLDLPLQTVYYAFYSDTKLSFHPHFLFPVHPGDALFARLRLAGGRWHVLIVDHTHARRAAFSTRDDAVGAFNQAEWLQEDVTARPGHLFPYPVLSVIHFRHLKVNFRTPSYANLRSQWMSENGTDLAPTPDVGDAFDLAPTRPSAIGLHYLQITIPLDLAIRKFAVGLSALSRASDQTRAAQRAALVTALQLNIEEVSGTQWPASVQPLCDQLVAATKSELAATESEPAHLDGGSLDWIVSWSQAYDRATTISQQIRRALNLPQVFPLPRA